MGHNMTIWNYYKKGNKIASYYEKENLYYSDEQCLKLAKDNDQFYEDQIIDLNKVMAISGAYESNTLRTHEKDEVLNKEYCNSHEALSLWCEKSKETNLLDFFTYQDKIIAFSAQNGMMADYLIVDGCEHFTPCQEWIDMSKRMTSRVIQPCQEYDVEMSDGTRLATEVYLPEATELKEKFPTILCRTPYSKERLRAFCLYFVEKGYALVLQDVRGRYKSEGTFLSQYYEGIDGNETVNWIVEQDWSDKNVGTIGGSYSGYVQWAIVKMGNPYLKAVISQVTGGSPFVDIDRRGGGYNMGIMPWNMMMSEKEITMEYSDLDWEEISKTKPLKHILSNVSEKEHPFWNQFLSHPHKDEFWDEMDLKPTDNVSDVSALVISGWHDGDINGSMEAWRLIEKYQVNPQKSKLIMGPWEHGFNSRRYTGESPLGANAILYNMDLLYLKWFEQFLKNKDQGLQEIKNRYYVEGLNLWMDDETFPPKCMSHSIFFLCKNGEKSLLSSKKEWHDEQSNYNYDPAHPAKQLLDPLTKKPFVPMDYSDMEQGDDVISFTSEVFQSDYVITGFPVVKLFASSTGRDTDFVVRLTLVNDSKKSLRITDGYIRARYRNGFTKEELLTPGKVEVYEIEMNCCSQLIKKGESIRLQILSAQDGEMFPNTNTGNKVEEDEDMCVVTQTVHHNQLHDSHVMIPMCKKEDL